MFFILKFTNIPVLTQQSNKDQGLVILRPPGDICCNSHFFRKLKTLKNTNKKTQHKVTNLYNLFSAHYFHKADYDPVLRDKQVI